MKYFSSAYLAPIQYYTKLYGEAEVMLEQHDHYMKQTYRNRCIIAAPDGPLALTIPVEKPDGGKCAMKDVRISDHGRWRHLHWNALETSYRTSPFFDYYADYFSPFYEKKYDFLIDFNEALHYMVCELIDMDVRMRRSDVYGEGVVATEDFRDVISPKYRGVDSAFSPMPYYQVFREKNGFLPNLSIVDLLFNMGPESLIVLRDSRR